MNIITNRQYKDEFITGLAFLSEYFTIFAYDDNKISFHSSHPFTIPNQDTNVILTLLFTLLILFLLLFIVELLYINETYNTNLIIFK